jgi:hypothetical protein
MSAVPDPIPVPEPPPPSPVPPPTAIIPRARLVVLCVSAFKERSDAEAWQFCHATYQTLFIEVRTAPVADGGTAVFRSPIILHPLTGQLVGMDEMAAQFPANIYMLIHADWPKCDDEWRIGEIREGLKPAAVEAAQCQRSRSLARLAEARQLLSGQRTRLTRESPSLPPRPRCGADELEVEPPRPHHHPVPIPNPQPN